MIDCLLWTEINDRCTLDLTVGRFLHIGYTPRNANLWNTLTIKNLFVFIWFIGKVNAISQSADVALSLLCAAVGQTKYICLSLICCHFNQWVGWKLIWFDLIFFWFFVTITNRQVINLFYFIWCQIHFRAYLVCIGTVQQLLIRNDFLLRISFSKRLLTLLWYRLYSVTRVVTHPTSPFSPLDPPPPSKRYVIVERPHISVGNQTIFFFMA